MSTFNVSDTVMGLLGHFGPFILIVDIKRQCPVYGPRTIIHVLNKILNISKFFKIKFSIFTAENSFCILQGQVFIIL